MTEQVINFNIEHLDPLGQGVYKENDQIYFIPKTLPNEKGMAKITKRSKGVNFAQVLSVNESSPLRIEPECPHYTQCLGCSYLHCTRESELAFKKNALEKQLQKISNLPPVEIIAENSRSQYRNRIQLHYDINQKKLGFINKNSRSIIPVPNCILPDNIISEKLRDWYLNNNWEKYLPKKSPKQGHV